MAKRTEDEEECVQMAMQVDFLETREEYELYAGALLAAKRWGEKIDRETKRVSNERFLKEKYNK